MNIKKIIAREGLVIALLMISVSVSLAQIEGQQYNEVKLKDGTKLLVNKKTDEVEFDWSEKEQRWRFLTRYADGLSEPIRYSLQDRYNNEKMSQ